MIPLTRLVFPSIPKKKKLNFSCHAAVVGIMSRNADKIRTLIIDNYDSYTFNLLQLFADPSNVVIIRNDQFTW